MGQRCSSCTMSKPLPIEGLDSSQKYPPEDPPDGYYNIFLPIYDVYYKANYDIFNLIDDIEVLHMIFNLLEINDYRKLYTVNKSFKRLINEFAIMQIKLDPQARFPPEGSNILKSLNYLNKLNSTEYTIIKWMSFSYISENILYWQNEVPLCTGNHYMKVTCRLCSPTKICLHLDSKKNNCNECIHQETNRYANGRKSSRERDLEIYEDCSSLFNSQRMSETFIGIGYIHIFLNCDEGIIKTRLTVKKNVESTSCKYVQSIITPFTTNNKSYLSLCFTSYCLTRTNHIEIQHLSEEKFIQSIGFYDFYDFFKKSSDNLERISGSTNYPVATFML